jgi:hypothetical protein
MEGITFREGSGKLLSLKVTECPLVFPINVGWREGKALGSGDTQWHILAIAECPKCDSF